MGPFFHEENLLVPECQNMTASFRKNGMWKRLFNRSHSVLFGQSISPREDIFRTKTI